MSSKLVTEGPQCFKAGLQPWHQHPRMQNKRKRNHSAGQCHDAPAHTNAAAHSQPAMPEMISLLFICKTGAVGVAQMILLLDFATREAQNAV